MTETYPNQAQAAPVVAIVGRPNVGKSSLFNRLAGRRTAIVHAERGVTRDRISRHIEWEGRGLELIDTGGLAPEAAHDDGGELEVLVNRQVLQAVQAAAAVIFVADITAGRLPWDDEVAGILRRAGKPVFLAANKADCSEKDVAADDFLKYGFPVFPLSVTHNRGVRELMSSILAVVPEHVHAALPEALRVAIVGRPNVGKSSFVNRLLCSERVIVSDQPGTTRDSIDVPFVLSGGGKERHYLLTDTAGIRKRGKINRTVERFSMSRALRSIARSDVTALVLDAAQGPTAQDKTIARMILDHHKGCLLLVNKWDLLAKSASEQEYGEALYRAVPFLRFAPAVFISAQTGFNIRRALTAMERVSNQINLCLPTGALNRALTRAYDRVQPPLVQGKRLKFYYAVQTDVQPIRVLLFVNDPARLVRAYEEYLIHALREEFGLEGAPVVLQLKSHRALEK